jgi:hypothetical protein
MKVIRHPITGQPFRMGRTRPAMRPQLRFARYLDVVDLPASPVAVDYASKATTILSQILGNDQYGDCTVAGAFHVHGTILANAGEPPDPGLSAANATNLYLQLTGGKDIGLDEQTVLNHWQKDGLLPGGTRKIAGWMAVDATNKAHCQLAAWLFENLYFGVELPDAWINPMPSASGFLWDVAGAPDPGNGHCFVAPGYDAAGPKCATWGMVGNVSWEAVAKYAVDSASGELYTVISADGIAKATARCPAGVDWAGLVADFAALGGTATA